MNDSRDDPGIWPQCYALVVRTDGSKSDGRWWQQGGDSKVVTGFHSDDSNALHW